MMERWVGMDCSGHFEGCGRPQSGQADPVADDRACYLTMRLLLTLEPPQIGAASLPAALFWSKLSTKPLSCTTPFMVSTFISNDLTMSSFNSAPFTLVVIPVSSTYWPVLSLVRVSAQPPKNPPTATIPASVAIKASLRV